ncbi:hypothetical protein [Salinibius halmophilus]|uniref:hypothetical protein n=1 Tax=Salinibius halmophilus TaxID=1853216 RepID=UPI000E65FCA0|nr:hypothetical protein [Salinibius halmophilus]
MKLAATIILFMATSVSAAELVFPRHTVEGDARQLYGENLLQKIVAGTDFSVRTSDWPMTRARMELELQTGERINIMLLPERPDYDAAYLKIPVSVDNGLIGQRVALVASERDPFANVTDLAEVADLVGCTNPSWTVTRWYELSGFKLKQLPVYDNLFVYTERGACDYFSRSVLEVEQELKQQQEKGRQLRIDSHVLLQVPISQYYYISPNAEALVAPLTQVVSQAKASGVVDRFLTRYTESIFDQISLENRRIIELNSLD